MYDRKESIKTFFIEKKKNERKLKDAFSKSFPKGPRPDVSEDVKPEISSLLHERKSCVLSEPVTRPGMTRTEYWQNVIAGIEQLTKRQQQPKFNTVNHVNVLSPAHKQRVSKIIPYEHSETDDGVFIKDFMRVRKEEREFKRLTSYAGDIEVLLNKDEERGEEEKKPFNESEYSIILQKERLFRPLNLKLEEKSEFFHSHEQCWMAKFLAQTKEERVIWNTKACKKEFVSPTEKADDLFNESAEHFIGWVNKIGALDNTNISIEGLRVLFGEMKDNTLVCALNSREVEMKAIPKTAASAWNKTYDSIENQYEQFLSRRKKKKPRLLSAFGRTIPPQDRPWFRHLNDHPLTCPFPDEVMSLQRIFRGLSDLRSIPPLVRYYLKHPKLKKPEYLINIGAFDRNYDKKLSDLKEKEERLGKNTLYGKMGLDYINCEYRPHKVIQLN